MCSRFSRPFLGSRDESVLKRKTLHTSTAEYVYPVPTIGGRKWKRKIERLPRATHRVVERDRWPASKQWVLQNTTNTYSMTLFNALHLPAHRIKRKATATLYVARSTRRIWDDYLCTMRALQSDATRRPSDRSINYGAKSNNAKNVCLLTQDDYGFNDKNHHAPVYVNDMLWAEKCYNALYKCSGYSHAFSYCRSLGHQKTYTYTCLQNISPYSVAPPCQRELLCIATNRSSDDASIKNGSTAPPPQAHTCFSISVVSVRAVWCGFAAGNIGADVSSSCLGWSKNKNHDFKLYSLNILTNKIYLYSRYNI